MVTLPDVSCHHLLLALPRQDRERLIDWSDLVHLARGDTVYAPGQLIDYMYFPLSAVLSLFGITMEGESVELCQVGREGVAGVSHMLSDPDVYQPDMLKTDVLMPGHALRIATEDVADALNRSSAFCKALQGYLNVLFSHLITGSTCNRHHPLEQRCARWMLSMQDRTATPEIQATQENLSAILGVRRQSIDIVLRTLSLGRLIESSRGKVSIINRKGLEDRACECYGNAKRRLDRFLREISALQFGAADTTAARCL